MGTRAFYLQFQVKQLGMPKVLKVLLGNSVSYEAQKR